MTDSYFKAIRRALLVGVIAGILIGSYYGLVVKKYEEDALQVGIGLGVVYGLTLACLMACINALQIFVARRSLSRDKKRK